MLGEYRNLLAKDDVLEINLARLSPPRARPVVIAVIALACAVLLAFFVLERGLSRFLFLAIVLTIAVSSVFQFARERAIVRQLGKAVGTVFHYQKVLHGKGGSSARIKYAFLSAENQVFIGRGRMSGRSGPKVGQTLPILYNLTDPSANLPLANVWFYGFHAEIPSIRSTFPNS
jgi:hypothetical protein